jgi:hypothetical protein
MKRWQWVLLVGGGFALAWVVAAVFVAHHVEAELGQMARRRR